MHKLLTSTHLPLLLAEENVVHLMVTSCRMQHTSLSQLLQELPWLQCEDRGAALLDVLRDPSIACLLPRFYAGVTHSLSSCAVKLMQFVSQHLQPLATPCAGVDGPVHADQDGGHGGSREWWWDGTDAISAAAAAARQAGSRQAGGTRPSGGMQGGSEAAGRDSSDMGLHDFDEDEVSWKPGQTGGALGQDQQDPEEGSPEAGVRTTAWQAGLHEAYTALQVAADVGDKLLFVCSSLGVQLRPPAATSGVGVRRQGGTLAAGGSVLGMRDTPLRPARLQRAGMQHPCLESVRSEAETALDLVHVMADFLQHAAEAAFSGSGGGGGGDDGGVTAAQTLAQSAREMKDWGVQHAAAAADAGSEGGGGRGAVGGNGGGAALGDTMPRCRRCDSTLCSRLPCVGSQGRGSESEGYPTHCYACRACCFCTGQCMLEAAVHGLHGCNNCLVNVYRQACNKRRFNPSCGVGASTGAGSSGESGSNGPQAGGNRTASRRLPMAGPALGLPSPSLLNPLQSTLLALRRQRGLRQLGSVGSVWAQGEEEPQGLGTQGWGLDSDPSSATLLQPSGGLDIASLEAEIQMQQQVQQIVSLLGVDAGEGWGPVPEVLQLD